jgi:2-C-methyl-D-erythritol 4-phosphate cytidylyltransferase
MTIWAILPAAGIGRRLGSIIPKQYLPLNGIPVIQHSLKLLAQFNAITRITVVLNPADEHWPEVNMAEYAGDRVVTVAGGDQRSQSVLNGLHSLDAKADDWVLVHDAVRPCVTALDVQRLLAGITIHPELAGGILASPMSNTVKRVSEAGLVEATVDRSFLWNALTPQVFRYGLLCSAMEAAERDGLNVTDEASAMEHAGHAIKVIAASNHNIKITHASDLALAELILKAQDEGL